MCTAFVDPTHTSIVVHHVLLLGTSCTGCGLRCGKERPRYYIQRTKYQGMNVPHSLLVAHLSTHLGTLWHASVTPPTTMARMASPSVSGS